MRGWPSGVIVVTLVFSCLTGRADIDLTTLPERQQCHLVVYSAVNLTVVRDRRTIPLAAGPSHIEFTWADTLITPDSLRLRAVDRPQIVRVVEASYPPNRINTLLWDVESAESGDFLTEVSYFTHGLFWRPHYRVVANDDESSLRLIAAFEIQNQSGEDYRQAQLQLVSGDVEYVTPLPGGGRGLPRAQQAVPFDHWAYDALGKLTEAGAMAGYADKSFKGGRAMTRYEFGMAANRLLQQLPRDAEARYGAGLAREVDRLVEEFRPEIAETAAQMGTMQDDLARRGIARAKGPQGDRGQRGPQGALGPPGRPPPAEAPPPVAPEALGESYIYEIGGLHDMEDDWRVRFVALEAGEVPAKVRHKFEPTRYGQRVRKFYVFDNDQDSGLGRAPLAGGEAYVMRSFRTRGLVPVVVSRMPYGAVGAEVELDAGFDPLIVAERKLMDYKKVELSFDRFGKVKGWDTEEDFQIELRNRSEKPITVEVLEHQDGDWTLTSPTAFEKLDQNTVKFVLEVASQAAETIKFHVAKHFGKNSQG
ncbi:MAG: DUF4139 domain-containing protein [Armatimonadota bacterium]